MADIFYGVLVGAFAHGTYLMYVSFVFSETPPLPRF
jgi:hypothetical protein